MAKFKPHSPDTYPIAWTSAARNALLAPGEWQSVDWARGEAGAVARMKRLRAFRDGISLYPGRFPELAQALSEGKQLAFRKIPSAGVWDVQLRIAEPTKLEFSVASESK